VTGKPEVIRHHFAAPNDREEYYLTQRYGLVQWDYYVLAMRIFVQLPQTAFNKLVVGAQHDSVLLMLTARAEQFL
jgi:hypothetical protein